MNRKGSTISTLASTRWDTRMARRVVARWQRSGMTGAAFARAHGVKEQRLSWWRKQLEQEEDGHRPQVASAAFLPAAVTQVPVSGRVVVRLPGGVEVEAGGVAALPAAWLAGVARELARPA